MFLQHQMGRLPRHGGGLQQWCSLEPRETYKSTAAQLMTAHDVPVLRRVVFSTLSQRCLSACSRTIGHQSWLLATIGAKAAGHHIVHFRLRVRIHGVRGLPVGLLHVAPIIKFNLRLLTNYRQPHVWFNRIQKGQDCDFGYDQK